MSILSTNKKLISIGAEYSAGQGIDITNHVISVVESAVGTNYSAGPNIDIYNDEGQPTISSKDWSSEIADASANAYEQAIAQIPDPQDLSYISAKVDTNTSGIDYISSVCLTAHQDWTDTIKGASSYSYEQSTSYFDNWVEGQYTGDITNITNKITALSGNFGDYYKKTETSSKDEINDALQYVSANAGKVYEGVSPIVVNNTEDKISAETWTFSAGSNVSFVDDNVNKITRIDVELPQPQDLSYISAQTDKANQGVDYLSGVVITALPSDMATTGDVAELAQTISETYYPNTNPSSFVNEDWVTAQGYITGVDLSDYAERAFVLSSIESATSGKLDVSSFASVSSDFLTNEDLDSYYTKSETSGADQLADAFANIPAGDVGVNTYVQNNSATINEVNTTYQSNSGNYITAHQSLDGYATEDWVTGQGYLTGVSIPESATWNDVSETVQTNSSVWNDKLDSSSLDLKIGQHSDFAPGITGAYRISGAPIIAENALCDSQGRYFTTWYQLKDDNLLSGTKYGTLKIDNENTHLVDTTFSALSSYNGVVVSAIPYSGAGFWNDYGDYHSDSTTSHSYDNVKTYSINMQSWDGGFTAQINGTNYDHSYFDGSHTITGEFNTPSTLVVNLYRSNNYAEPTIKQFNLGVESEINEVVDIRNVFATNEQLNTASSYLSGAIDYVSSNAGGNDLVHKSDFTFVSDQWGTYLQKVSGKYIDYATRAGRAELDLNGHEITTYYFTTANANTLSSMLSGAIDYVSANAGGDVPTGTMNVSGLEYNAVGEISGYGSSAIAQYGAEKQWLVHDGTLCHLSNSAQYALGVNVSALQRLMGIDETVLWSGEPQKAPITLSESYKNFKELKIVGRLNDSNAVGTVASWRFDTDIISANPYLNCQSFVANSTGNSAYGAYLRNSVEVVSSDTGIGHWHTFSYSYTTANQITMQTNDEWGKLFYYKVIGIGRISG